MGHFRETKPCGSVGHSPILLRGVFQKTATRKNKFPEGAVIVMLFVPLLVLMG